MKEAIDSMDLQLLKAGAIETFNFLLICKDTLNNIPIGVKCAGARGDTKTRGLYSDTITPNILCGKRNTRRLTGMITLQTNIEKYLMGASNTKRVLDDLLKAYLPASRKGTSQDYTTGQPVKVGAIAGFHTRMNPVKFKTKTIPEAKCRAVNRNFLCRNILIFKGNKLK